MKYKLANNRFFLDQYQLYQVREWDKENRKKAQLNDLADLDHIYKKIRKSCFQPMPDWTCPTKEEVTFLFNLTNLKQKDAAKYLGLKDNDGRSFRRFLSGESTISYSYWVMLCDYVGIPRFW